MNANRLLVSDALNQLFNHRVVANSIAPHYVVHSNLIAGGRDGLARFVAEFPASARYEPARIFADGDLVAVHGRYVGLQDAPIAAFDIFRVLNGQIVEHWQGVQPEQGPNPSGHTMLDGPADVTVPEQTERTRAVLRSFAETILIGQDYERFGEFLGAYIQHNPALADGLEGLMAAQASGVSAVYATILLEVVEGEFGLLVNDGTLNGLPARYFDLFRVANDRIEEHWDVIEISA